MKEKIKDWLKENWFKISILATAFSIGLSVVYNYVVFLPQKEQTRIENQEKEYIAKRKNECYDIYGEEREKFNNVEGMEYNEKKDVCLIRYETEVDKRTGKTCEGFNLFERVAHCTKKIYTQEF